MADDLQHKTINDRDVASELRAWLMTYSNLSVSRYDAENLRDFLIKSGWREPK